MHPRDKLFQLWRRRDYAGLQDGSAFGLEAKTSSFDKLRMRFSNAEAYTLVLILSLSKDEDHAPRWRM